MSLRDLYNQAREKSDGIGKMKYPVSDDRIYRDVHDDASRNRKDRKPAGRPTLAYVLGALSFVGVLIIPRYAFAEIYKMLYSFTKGANPNYVSPPFSYFYNAVWHSSYGLPLTAILFLASIACGAGVYYVTYRQWKVNNVRNDTSDFTKHDDASRLLQIEELPQKFDIFPDSGQHSKNTFVSAIVGHIMLNNDGLSQIHIVDRVPQGDEEADEPYYDDNDALMYRSVSPIDTEFGEKLFDSAQLPLVTGNAEHKRRAKSLRVRYSPRKLLYNQDHIHGKDDYLTVADKINHDWYFPDYEVQRAGGMYIVDSYPSNTMVC